MYIDLGVSLSKSEGTPLGESVPNMESFLCTLIMISLKFIRVPHHKMSMLCCIYHMLFVW